MMEQRQAVEFIADKQACFARTINETIKRLSTIMWHFIINKLLQKVSNGCLFYNALMYKMLEPKPQHSKFLSFSITL